MKYFELDKLFIIMRGKICVLIWGNIIGFFERYSYFFIFIISLIVKDVIIVCFL